VRSNPCRFRTFSWRLQKIPLREDPVSLPIVRKEFAASHGSSSKKLRSNRLIASDP
jgi:hypothetical protein